MTDPAKHIEWGCRRPYDDASENGAPYEGHDPARRAVLGVLDDLCDRRGIKRGFEDVDDDVRAEIVESLTAIVREAFTQGAASSGDTLPTGRSP